MEDPLFLDQILQTFTVILTGGFLRVRPWVMNTMLVLISVAMVIGFSLLAAHVAGWLGAHSASALVQAIELIFRIGVLVAIAKNWLTITDGFMNSIVWLGMQIGGSTVTPEEFLSPGSVLLLGMRLATNFFTAAAGWGSDWFLAPFLFLCYLAAFWALIFCFFAIALAIMVAVVEYQVLNVFAFLMWPFMSIEFISWISEGLIRYLTGAALRLGGLAALFSIVMPFSVTLGLPTEGDITLQRGVMTVVGCIALVFLVLRGPAMLGGSAIPGRGLVRLGVLAWAGLRRA